MKLVALVPVWLAVLIATCIGQVLPPPAYEPGIVQFSYSFNPLPPLPRRFQNHCGWFDGRYVCANHCGPNYQFYYCSDWSSGCCHIGLGYCNAGGFLRCMPHYFPFY